MDKLNDKSELKNNNNSSSSNISENVDDDKLVNSSDKNKENEGSENKVEYFEAFKKKTKKKTSKELELAEYKTQQASTQQASTQQASTSQKTKNKTRLEFITQLDSNTYTIPKGHVKGMNVNAKFFANESLYDQLMNEYSNSINASSGGGFTPALRQISNVATLPGIVGESIGMPDIHSGYGFAIGNVAAMDMEDPNAVISPGGVGFDINCGVRLLRTNLTKDDILKEKENLANSLYRAVPVGVGSQSSFNVVMSDLEQVMEKGMQWSEERGYSWPEDKEVVEENGCFKNAISSQVSKRAKSRGKPQVGTLGSGNHYVEVQVVDEIYDESAAETMGLKLGNICIMIHSGSRGLGHQVCTDALSICDRYLKEKKVKLLDRQLAYVPIKSKEGKIYMASMSCAANFAFCNRTLMAYEVREAFEKVFKKSSRNLDMHVVYDVSHNIAKIEEHTVNGEKKKLLVHRKGATRSFPPGHPEIPDKYKSIGQPVLIGGSMGTCSYVLTGTHEAMEKTFGSTCHGAGRAMSRSRALKELESKEVMKNLKNKNVTLKIATKNLVAEEAPESYKNVSEVVDTCHEAGISKKCVKLVPLIVVKG